MPGPYRAAGFYSSSDSTSRITGSGYQYIYILLSFLLNEISQQTRHETTAYIFEG